MASPATAPRQRRSRTPFPPAGAAASGSRAASPSTGAVTDVADPRLRHAGYLFFFLSGATALAYEIVWLRLLGHVFGNTTHALAAVLAVFMAGLGVGSWVAGRWADRIARPFRLYGIFEIAIGVYAALTLALVKLVEVLYIATAHSVSEETSVLVLVRVAGSFLLLFPPTFCMGATLPLLTRFYIHRQESIGRGIGLLYGLNTLGAVAGTVLTGYWFIASFGQMATVLGAAAVNVAIGVAAIRLSAQYAPVSPKKAETAPSPLEVTRPARGMAVWLPAGLLFSGFVALVYEVAWTRALAVVIGSSTYAFTIMLATFLTGLAGGSFLAERFLTKRSARFHHWAALQVLIAGTAMATLPLFDDIDLVLMRLIAANLEATAFHDLSRFVLCSALMILPTLAMGALFPVSMALYAEGTGRLGKDVGTLYLFNTVGSLSGSLAAGFVLIPAVGIHQTILLMILLGGGVGLYLLFFTWDSRKSLPVVAGLAAVLIAGLFLQRDGWGQVPFTSLFHYDAASLAHHTNEQVLSDAHMAHVVSYREGTSAVVSVDQTEGEYTLRVNGKPDASTRLQDQRTQAMLGHLPHLLHSGTPRQSLLIGFGSGATAAAAMEYGLERLDCAEIEPAVIEAAPWFDKVNNRVYEDPRFRLLINDGRNSLLISEETYDVIVSEPSNPWIAGIANLFTVEFYRLVDERLAPDGVFCQWVQTYKMDPADVKMIVASLRTVFPEVEVWSANRFDLLLIARREPVPFDVARVQSLFDQNPKLAAEFKKLGVHGPGGVLAYFLLDREGTGRYAKGGRLNRDNHLPLEFSAPRNHYRSSVQAVLEDLASHRTGSFPPSVPADPGAVPGVLTQMGEALVLAERVEEAEVFLRQALERNPKDARALVALARVHHARQRPEESAQAILEAFEADPDDPVVLEYWGIMNMESGRMDQGIPAIQDALRQNPGNALLHGYLAMGLEQQGKLREAMEAHSKAAEAAPIAAPVGVARCLAALGEREQALEVLREVMESYPLDYRAYEVLTAICRTTGDLAPAVVAHEELVERNPWNSFFRRQLQALKEG